MYIFQVSAGYRKCTETHTEEEYSIVCNLDLMPNSKQSIIATSEILKSKIGKHFSVLLYDKLSNNDSAPLLNSVDGNKR